MDYTMPATYWLRSTLFNLAFYSVTTIGCILAIPCLILSPRIFVKVTVQTWCKTVYALERLILGLDFEIKGKEHIPEDGAYLIAAKHQSPYETLKLHLLFDYPAIILKKELLSIPLFGWYLQKADLIAIDRSSKELAMRSIQDGARHAQSQGRPIVIFPQGTRVGAYTETDKKPYKFGITKIQDATDLPVIPLALNCGLFWPKKGWLKHPGKITFEFLPPIESGLKKDVFIKRLEETLEASSNILRDEEIKKREA